MNAIATAPLPVAPAERAPAVPVWRLALLSFVPSRHRSRWERRTAHLPLTVVLSLQAIFSLRLANTAFQDEALYIYTGHWIIRSWQTGEALYIHPEAFFSGAPQLYPVLAALLDDVGGLRLVRCFSVLCMVSATLAVYWTTNQLFAGDRSNRRCTGNHPGAYAAVVFATSASVIFLGNFATFDAPSFTILSWATALAVSASRSPARRRPRLFVVAAAAATGALCALAVLLKYSAAIDVPFILLLVVVAPHAHRRLQGWAAGLIAGTTCLAILGGSALTWAAPLLAGLRATTTARSATSITPAAQLAEQVLRWDGISLGLILVGALVLLPRAPSLSVVLGVGSTAATAYQIHMGELVSLHKHVVLGLILGAPLAGVALARLARIPWGRAVTLLVIWCAFIVGMFQSKSLYTGWPETSGLTGRLSYSISAMPWIRMVGDNPEPLQYAFQDRTQPWQWTSTYENAFTYKGLTGVEAYRAAFRDNYFQLVFFDGTNPISAQLMPEMASYRFRETGVVSTAWNAHQWHIYERYEKLE